MLKPRVAFNARILCEKEVRGWSRYTLELLRGLDRQGVETLLLSDRPLYSDHLRDLKHSQSAVKKGLNYIDWEQRVLPSMAKKMKADLIHCPINYGLPYLCGLPTIVTIHDIIDYKMGSSPDFKVHLLQAIARQRSDHIITVSQFTKKDLCQTFNLSPHKVSVIYEASFSQPDSKAVFPAQLAPLQEKDLSDQFFLYLGGFDPRKNIEFLLRAYAQAKPERKLVLAGEKNQDRVRSMQSLAQQLGVDNQVIFLNWLEDEEIAWLYQHAYCFVYPSLYEGFGLQIVESMHWGTPVICSNATSLPEILDCPEATFNPNRGIELTNLIKRTEQAPRFYEKILEHAQKRIGHFDWNKTAKETLACYQKLLSKAPAE